jgi:hypothetical protein
MTLMDTREALIANAGAAFLAGELALSPARPIAETIGTAFSMGCRETSKIAESDDGTYFLPGDIHSTQGVIVGATVYLRFTSQNLEEVWCDRYNPVLRTRRAFTVSPPELASP